MFRLTEHKKVRVRENILKVIGNFQVKNVIICCSHVYYSHHEINWKIIQFENLRIFRPQLFVLFLFIFCFVLFVFELWYYFFKNKARSERKPPPLVYET